MIGLPITDFFLTKIKELWNDEHGYMLCNGRGWRSTYVRMQSLYVYQSMYVYWYWWTCTCTCIGIGERMNWIEVLLKCLCTVTFICECGAKKNIAISDHEILPQKITFMSFSTISRRFWTTKIWSYPVWFTIVTKSLFTLLFTRWVFGRDFLPFLTRVNEVLSCPVFCTWVAHVCADAL